MTDLGPFHRAVVNLLGELVDGAPEGQAAFVLNPGDPGLLASLAKLSAAEASALPAGGGGSVAAHVDHLRYGFELLNRWGRGEKDPFSNADYKSSWARVTVDEAEWTARRDALRREVDTWRELLGRPSTREVGDVELLGILSSVTHLAYHVGAIRQINRAMRGPSAND